MLESLGDAGLPRGAVIDIVYNWDNRERPHDVECRLRKVSGKLPISVHFNTQRPTIGSGRAQQLTHCKSALIAFIDDDLTVHGDLFTVLEQQLRRVPLGIVGVQSLLEDSDQRFKPRRATPHVDALGVRFMPVQGMLVAGYRRLFLDIGGFNPRREFWGEWTELNLRMWRNGFPTGYMMNGAYLRHWEKAPESPTRNMDGREDHILWGLMCTALEYDAIDAQETTESFWSLVESRYLAYAFGPGAPSRDMLRSLLRLAPRLSGEYPAIARFRELVRKHPFPFMPFHRFSEQDVHDVVRHANTRIEMYRDDVWDTAPVRAARWVGRRLAFA